MLHNSIQALSSGNTTLARIVKEQEEDLDELEASLRLKHMERLDAKKCSPEFTVIYMDVIHNIERIGDSCENIANAVLDNVNFKDIEEN